MKVTLVFLTLMTLTLSSVAAPPSQRCTTTLQVNTCGDTPVDDRKIKIETSDGESFKKRTDPNGQIVLDICHEDISTLKISGVNNRKVSKAIAINSNVTEVFATITLNICGA
ncbi:MAG: hypothetical protein DRJ61_19340 [Acidobacteria bacterium]|nr:MAG: hypothetical protein DRJ61_19340 [Acidobacteriota bacterium]